MALSGQWLGMGRVWVGATCCGKAERLFDLAKDWASTRRQFGQPIGKFQATGFKLADMAMEIDASRLMVHRAAWMASNGVPFEQAEVVVLGSVHMAYPDIYPLRPEIEDAFAAADKLVVEVDIG